MKPSQAVVYIRLLLVRHLCIQHSQIPQRQISRNFHWCGATTLLPFSELLLVSFNPWAGVILFLGCFTLQGGSFLCVLSLGGGTIPWAIYLNPGRGNRSFGTIDQPWGGGTLPWVTISLTVGELSLGHCLSAMLMRGLSLSALFQSVEEGLFLG